MKLQLDASILYDLVKNHDSVDLSYTSIEAILDYYDELDENIEYDVSLFWCWEEYGSLEEAYRQKVKEGYFEKAEYEDEEESELYEDEDFFREKLLERFEVVETPYHVCICCE